MVLPGKIVKNLPGKQLEVKYKIQSRAFSETSHIAAMIFARLRHELNPNDICSFLQSFITMLFVIGTEIAGGIFVSIFPVQIGVLSFFSTGTGNGVFVKSKEKG